MGEDTCFLLLEAESVCGLALDTGAGDVMSLKGDLSDYTRPFLRADWVAMPPIWE